MPSEIVDAMANFRRALDAQDRSQAARLAAMWRDVTQGLEAEMQRLAQEIADRVVRGLPATLWHVQRMERYQTLMAQVVRQLRQFNPLVIDDVTAMQSLYARWGLEHSQALLDQAVPGIVAQFDRLPVSAFINMVGNTGAGTPLGRLLTPLPRQGAQAVSQALMRGVALGWHPAKTAAAMMADAGLSYQRAIVMARTEQLRVYRHTSLENYRTSGLVTGWMWKAAPGPRTCAACLAMDGSVHPLTEDFGSHPACRCAPVPLVRGAPPLRFETGEQWFDRQDAQIQRQILGPGRYAVYRRGVPFQRFATTRHDATWGDSVVVTPLHELVN